MEQKIKYWHDLATYDLDTAKAMLKSKRFLYVGYMCHQVIEKILKAYYVKIAGKIPPYTHNLYFLTTESGLDSKLTEKQKILLDELEPLNIEARYPEYKERLLKQLTIPRCKEIISETEKLYQWIYQLL